MDGTVPVSCIDSKADLSKNIILPDMFSWRSSSSRLDISGTDGGAREYVRVGEETTVSKRVSELLEHCVKVNLLVTTTILDTDRKMSSSVFLTSAK
jgi:hypothetical protein